MDNVHTLDPLCHDQVFHAIQYYGRYNIYTMSTLSWHNSHNSWMLSAITMKLDPIDISHDAGYSNV